MLTRPDIFRAIERGDIVIEPFRFEQLNPNSYNLRLGTKLLRYKDSVLDPMKDNPTTEVPLITMSWDTAHNTAKEENPYWLLQPGELYLGVTEEFTSTKRYVPMVNGRSSLARLGLTVHQTGGFGDIGFYGHWTLELAALHRVKIYPGMKILQICWFEPSSIPPEAEMYKGKYSNQSQEPVGSRIFTEMGVGGSHS